MKKETLITIILSTIGTLTFALGMCMVLLKELDMFTPGIIVGLVGLLILLSLIPLNKKKEKKPINYGLVITIITGIIGLLVCILNYPIYLYIKGNK